MKEYALDSEIRYTDSEQTEYVSDPIKVSVVVQALFGDLTCHHRGDNPHNRDSGGHSTLQEIPAELRCRRVPACPATLSGKQEDRRPVDGREIQLFYSCCSAGWHSSSSAPSSPHRCTRSANHHSRLQWRETAGLTLELPDDLTIVMENTAARSRTDPGDRGPKSQPGLCDRHHGHPVSRRCTCRYHQHSPGRGDLPPEVRIPAKFSMTVPEDAHAGDYTLNLQAAYMFVETETQGSNPRYIYRSGDATIPIPIQIRPRVRVEAQGVSASNVVPGEEGRSR